MPTADTKKSVILIIVFVLLLAAGIYLLYFKKKPVSAYPPGTNIQTSKDFPAGFPKQVLQEKYSLYHADTVKYPDGKEDMTVSYVSKTGLVDLLDLYRAYLKDNEWKIQTDQLLSNSAVLVASDSQGKLFVTIAGVKDGNMVTFLYKK